jgi:hypothetical protein
MSKITKYGLPVAFLKFKLESIAFTIKLPLGDTTNVFFEMLEFT